MDACFVYIYQYEPYLRDPVTYPKVQVRGQVGGEGHGPAVVRNPLGPFDEGAETTQVKVADPQMDFIVIPKNYRWGLQVWLDPEAQMMPSRSVSVSCVLPQRIAKNYT